MAYSWPTTKGTTTALDQSSDDPNVARPQIKQNIENVNKIIDNFATTTPANGDTWVFNSSTDKFEPSATGAGNEATIQFTGKILGGTRKAVFTTVRDSNSILTEQTESGTMPLTSVSVTNGQVSFQLATGTYRINCGEMIYCKGTTGIEWEFQKVDTGGTATTVFGNNDNAKAVIGGGSSINLFQNFDQREFTVADATDKYYFHPNYSSSGNWEESETTFFLEDVAVRITKIA